jgi:hypothetical protein
MPGHEGSNQESLLLAIAVAAAAFVFAAALNYKAAVPKDDAGKAGAISSLQIALSQRPHNDAKTTCAPSIAGSAFAQATNPKPTPTAPLDSAPGENLSKKLNQSNGVIHPKEVDPAIEKPAPKVGDPNVVPPPGTSGGAPVPQPK